MATAIVFDADWIKNVITLTWRDQRVVLSDLKGIWRQIIHPELTGMRKETGSGCRGISECNTKSNSNVIVAHGVGLGTKWGL